MTVCFCLVLLVLKFCQSKDCVFKSGHSHCTDVENLASLGQKRCRFIGLAKGTGVLSGDVPVN